VERVTGLGSLPGTDMGAALRLVFDEPGPLPTLPELPARGPWATMTGRATALLVDMPVEFTAGEWRLADHPGADARRARATLRDDLDMAEESAQGYSGALKVTVAGPWTLSAVLLRPLGGRVLGDRGARSDLAQSLAEGVSQHLEAVARRFPGATLVLQVDEPSLPAVLAGSIPTEGGFFRHRAVTEQEVATTLARLSALTTDSLLHSCAPGLPIGLVTAGAPDGAGFTGVSLDASRGFDPDAVSAAVESGSDLFWGIASPDRAPSVDRYVRDALSGLRPLELGDSLVDRLWLTPTCGLAGAEPQMIRPIFKALRRAYSLVSEQLR
jgi:hypothetical protein